MGWFPFILILYVIIAYFPFWVRFAKFFFLGVIWISGALFSFMFILPVILWIRQFKSMGFGETEKEEVADG